MPLPIRIILLLSFVAILGLSVVSAVARVRETGRKPPSLVPRPNLGDEFVSSDTCNPCHPGQFHSWHRTYHRTMTQVALPETVVGDFDGTRFQYHGRELRLERRDGEFWVHESGEARRVMMTTGFHHYQVYWIKARRGDWLENFPFVYLQDDSRWVQREDAFLMPPELSDTPGTPRTWNSICIECHTTNGNPRIDTQARRIDTEVAELGIACEACHGPAAEHVRANRDPRRRYSLHDSPRNEVRDSTIVNPSRLSHRASSQICGQCHSLVHTKDRPRWIREGSAYRAGDDLAETRFIFRHLSRLPRPPTESDRRRYAVARTPENYFWSDGMIRIAGREYNGLLETPCFQRGTMSCLSCHSMHESDPDDQLARGMESDEACLQCHDPYRDRIEAHTHHPEESAGSRCYNCHMPHTTYGLLKAIRSHEVDSPSIATTQRSGRPLACNLCHLDRTLEWSHKHLREWYDHEEAEFTGDERSIAAALLWLLRGDAGQRAITAWHLGWSSAQEASGTNWQAPFLAQLLADPYSAVRYVAYRALRSLPGYSSFEYDYVGPEAERVQARLRAMQQWENRVTQRENIDDRNEPVLLDGGGKLRVDVLDRLCSQRDNRPVQLLE